MYKTLIITARPGPAQLTRANNELPSPLSSELGKSGTLSRTVVHRARRDASRRPRRRCGPQLPQRRGEQSARAATEVSWGGAAGDHAGSGEGR